MYTYVCLCTFIVIWMCAHICMYVYTHVRSSLPLLKGPASPKARTAE